MSYQKCPVCNGEGKVTSSESTSMYKMCQICNGSGIIDELFGTPPPKHTVKGSDLNIQKVIETDLEG